MSALPILLAVWGIGVLHGGLIQNALIRRGRAACPCRDEPPQKAEGVADA